MNENIYDINYNRLGGWLLPPMLRKNKTLRFVSVLLLPIATLYQFFLIYRATKLYELTITPQKCYLERLLNDRYDSTLRRIYIDDGQEKPPFYIFQRPELKPKFIYKNTENRPKYIYTSGESGNLTDDFVIYVPMGLAFEEPEMVSLVKVYKLAGTKFKIQRF